MSSNLMTDYQEEFSNLLEEIRMEYLKQVMKRTAPIYIATHITNHFVYAGCLNDMILSLTICDRNSKSATLIHIVYIISVGEFTSTKGIEFVQDLVRDILLANNLII